MRNLGERPVRVRRVGLAGTNSVRYVATIRHGKGTREIGIDIGATEILALADAIRATAHSACNPSCREPHIVYNVGHAVWHLDNPNHPMPCVDHTTVIEMNTLLEGDRDE